MLIFPQVLKAGFVLGGSGGSGVLLVRDAKTGKWIGPAFYTMGSASLGFQAGASAAEVVMIINSQKALDSLFSNKVKLGGDASVAIGPKGTGAGVALDSDFIAYSTVKGAFAGLAIDGSVLDVRGALNSAYYGKKMTPVDILVKQARGQAGIGSPARGGEEGGDLASGVAGRGQRRLRAAAAVASLSRAPGRGRPASTCRPASRRTCRRPAPCCCRRR